MRLLQRRKPLPVEPAAVPESPEVAVSAPEVEVKPEAVVQPVPAAALHGSALAPMSAVESVSDIVSAQEPLRKRKSAGRWVAWTIAMVAMGIVVGLVAVFIMKFVDGPVDVHPAKSLAKLEATPTPTVDANELNGMTVNFLYPGNFDQMGQVRSDNQGVEQYNISSKSAYQRLIAVDVRNLPSSKLIDDSSYRIRQLDPQTYRESQEMINGETVILMTKSDGNEQTMFWPHHGKELVVAITSTYQGDSVTDFMKIIKTTVKWKI